MQLVSRRLKDFSEHVRENPRTAAVVSVIALIFGVALAALQRLSITDMMAVPLVLGLVILISLRRYILLGALIFGIAIFVDFYEVVGLPLHEPVVALLLASGVLAVIFFSQSLRFSWVPLRASGWWVLFLVVTALAIPRGGSLSQTVSYYVTIVGSSFVMYCLGTQITHSYQHIQWLVFLLLLLAAFIAAHTIIEGLTGSFLFATEHQSNYLGSVGSFQLAGSTSVRAGSFLLNPDWNGVFLAVMLFLAVGFVFTDVASRQMRLIAAITCALLLLALLFTFTTASWLSTGVGFILFLVFIIPKRYRRRVVIVSAIGLVLIALVFSRESRLLLQHSTTSNSISIRLGAWETAWKIIAAYPLTGIGMGYTLYFARAEAYRVPLQSQQLAHPHNSYLELAAFAGIPVLIAFLILLMLFFRAAWQTLRATDTHYRPLIGGVLISLVVLTINSLFINGWTLPPFACLGWLLMGAITSKALLQKHATEALETPAPIASQRKTQTVTSGMAHGQG